MDEHMVGPAPPPDDSTGAGERIERLDERSPSDERPKGLTLAQGVDVLERVCQAGLTDTELAARLASFGADSIAGLTTAQARMLLAQLTVKDTGSC